MLVISRKIGETFVIGDDLEVTVVDITGDKVVLGVLAPKETTISRIDAPKQQPTDLPINGRGYGRQYKKRLSE